MNAPEPTASDQPRIVGLGASAGGLDALQRFFGQTPPDTDLAFIVVQHLDPTQKGLLPELLQRYTAMPVAAAEHGVWVEPGSVHVIPPNSELSVVDNRLQLATPVGPRSKRLPVDVLFSSLARAQGENAIAVILSGMGSDGTIGMQAIKAVGGLCVVQDPATAEFGDMPQHAIDAGLADYVVAPGDVFARIHQYLAKAPKPVDPVENAIRPKSKPSSLQAVIKLVHQHTRHDFSLYKTSTLQRRIERRMAIHGAGSMAQYVDFLTHNTQEIDLLLKELLIGVTSFFRDPPVWEYLIRVSLPRLLLRPESNGALRAWSIGCSTGEEPYSLAMAFAEATDKLGRPDEFSLQIFASDLSPDAIAAARQGKYPESITASQPGFQGGQSARNGYRPTADGPDHAAAEPPTARRCDRNPARPGGA